jgi:DNA processing protein
LFPTSNRPPSPGESGVLPALELSENEQKVFDVLKTDDELGIDEVIRKSGLPSSSVSVSLLSLEMKRAVKQLPGKLFVRNN